MISFDPHEREIALISSIFSMNLRKIIFVPPLSFLAWECLLDNPRWTHFDEVLCALVDRLRVSGYENTLEVEIRAILVEPDEGVDHEKFLPKFKAKGRARVVEWP
jgi:hypothetical protein